MKKFIVGLILGISLTLAIGVQADGLKSFVGLKIENQFSVTVDGMTIAEPALVVEGRSYLPARKIAEIAGFEVGFSSEAGVSLTSKQETEEIPLLEAETTKDEILNRLETVNKDILQTNSILVRIEGKVEQESYDIFANRLTELESKKAALEAQLQETP